MSVFPYAFYREPSGIEGMMLSARKHIRALKLTDSDFSGLVDKKVRETTLRSRGTHASEVLHRSETGKRYPGSLL